MSQYIDNRNYIVVIDRSGSMRTKDCKDGRVSRWDAVQEATEDVADRACQLDPDGITVYTFSSQGSWDKVDNVTSDAVSKVFDERKPHGRTYLNQVLRDIFTSYLDRRSKGEVMGETVLVFTDGEANDKDDVVKEIHDFSHQLNADPEYAISFIQVGYDTEAGKFLTFLDDELGPEGHQRGKFDIVDTKTLDWVNENSVDKLLTEAITD